MASKAAAEAGPALSTMSITMMPFLYQTRTLSTLPWAITNTKFQSRRLSNAQRYLSSSAKSNLSFDGPWPPRNRIGLDHRPDYNSSGPNTRGSDQRPPFKKNQKRRHKPSEFDIPFEGGPSGASGRGGQRGAVGKRWESIKVGQFGETEDGIFEDLESETFLNEDGEEMDAEQYTGAGSMNLRGPRESTITDSERRAFQNIFSEMFSQNVSATPAIPAKSAKDTAKSKLNSILSNALDTTVQSRQEKEMVINRWPPALRASIAKAIGLRDDEEAAERAFMGEQAEKEPELNHDELEALREPERLRVETLMKEAKTDFDLWAIMEQEVFSLIPKLGLEAPLAKDVKSNEDKQLKKQRQKKPKAKAKIEKIEPIEEKEAEEPAILDNVADADSKSEVPALTVYGPLYPSYLLLGIRLLDRSFAKPSPLTLSILPKIVSLGAISHVLGASTQFYNEVLRVYFHRYEDFRSISATLIEMEQSAVEMDEETLDILVEILILRSRIRKGEKGQVARQIWHTMPHFRGANLQGWKEKIAHGLAEKKQHDGPVFLTG